MVADEPGEIGDDLWIRKIVMLRRLRKCQVMEHEPGDEFDVIVRKAQTFAELACELVAKYRMIAPPTLGDVVVEQRQIQQFRAL